MKVWQSERTLHAAHAAASFLFRWFLDVVVVDAVVRHRHQHDCYSWFYFVLLCSALLCTASSRSCCMSLLFSSIVFSALAFQIRLQFHLLPLFFFAMRNKSNAYVLLRVLLYSSLNSALGHVLFN